MDKQETKLKVLLIEDNRNLIGRYCASLRAYGFDVVCVSNESQLEGVLRENDFNIILSDTNLDEVEGGPRALDKAIKEGYLGENTLVIGMSSDSDNEYLWAGIANFACFYHKKRFIPGDPGKVALNRWNAFNSGVPGWKTRLLPKKDYV